MWHLLFVHILFNFNNDSKIKMTTLSKNKKYRQWVVVKCANVKSMIYI